MVRKNAAEMQNDRRTGEVRMLNSYSRAAEPSCEAEVGLSYGLTKGVSRTIRPTCGMLSSLVDGEMMVPVTRLTQFAVGADLEALLERAELKSQAFVDVWMTNTCADETRNGVSYREITGTLRRYDIRAGEFISEKVVTEKFVTAHSEREARNAEQAARRKMAKDRLVAEVERDRRATYGGCNVRRRIRTIRL